MRVFTEIQKFDQWWVRIFAFVICLVVLYPIFHIFQENLQANKFEFWISILATVTTLTIIFGIIFIVKLKIKIDEAGIYYGFLPFAKKLNFAKWQEIKECYVRTYNPLIEYGGWGYRRKLYGKNRAYNVKGNIGIQIVFNDGRKLLLGTQLGDEAQRVINRYQNPHL